MAWGMSDSVLHQGAPLVGVLGQQLAGPPDEAGGGLVAGPVEQRDEVHHLAPGEPAERAGLVGELGVEQLGHEVVGRVLGPPADVLAEEVGRAHVARAFVGEVGHGAVVQLEVVADQVPQGGLVLLGDAQQHADGPHRHLGAEVGDEVEAAGARVRVEAAGAELPQLGLQGVHLLGGEHPRHQAPVVVVDRRVLEDDEAGRDVHAALDDLEDGALGRAVGVPVLERRGGRRRSGSGRRSRTGRCGTAAPRRAAASRWGTGRRRSRSRTGRSTGRSGSLPRW